MFICTVCREHFKSETGFDKHRVGPHTKGGRRCLSTNEMVARGMVHTGKVWITKRNDFTHSTEAAAD